MNTGSQSSPGQTFALAFEPARDKHDGIVGTRAQPVKRRLGSGRVTMKWYRLNISPGQLGGIGGVFAQRSAERGDGMQMKLIVD